MDPGQILQLDPASLKTQAAARARIPMCPCVVWMLEKIEKADVLLKEMGLKLAQAF